ncbi:MAG TPA: ATP-binding protein [Bacteroidia bacterium]|nr:ATP-binding protein [Bacteroidia bacterium]
MHISKFRIQNYKSFLDSGEISFKPGINIITGQNNGGKTALMKALSLKFKSNPHKSTATLPNRDTFLNTVSTTHFSIEVPKELLEDFILTNAQIVMPLTEGYPSANSLQHEVFFKRLGALNTLNIITNNGVIHDASLEILGKNRPNVGFIYNVIKGNKSLIPTNNGGNIKESVLIKLATLLTSRIYVFDAERFNVSTYTAGTETLLHSNADNLPEVLANLQWNTARFEKYNSYIRKVFPNVHKVSVRIVTNQKFEIVVWNEDPSYEREDLVVPLSESGTGISQVLAILYVVLTSNNPTSIIIDEPNSFLHPGATRKLMEILKEHPQHQFIISTHSPEVISSSNPSTINIIKTKDAQSKAIPVDIGVNRNIQIYLTEIGSRLSDVFGSDNLLWVEGKTEELSFPKIVKKMKVVSLMGTSILSVRNTGDFDGKDARKTLEIYKKLSNGYGLMPSALRFVFDREKKTEKEIEDLTRESGGIMKFTKRRMFENYLINPKAIHTLLNKVPVTEMEITKWIEENKWDNSFISEKYAQDKKQENWSLYVDGANFLKTMFIKLSKGTLEFDKIEHSVALAEWIIENDFDQLKDYQDILREALKEK